MPMNSLGGQVIDGALRPVAMVADGFTNPARIADASSAGRAGIALR